ncbi:hypothetical protein MLD38_026123 [Melastoma candidum]|uniref:Uncharacterized protein n=1 Tax=Melastoma candidum TaxID=119954 RepID=A0ACB9NY12_9MYRT|nr:hypothetical protein MLD38_026123 [Melastoma candidum]
MAQNRMWEIVSSSPVVVFSKTYCGYCRRVKELLTQAGAVYKAIDLDLERDGDLMQMELVEWTGGGTVPNLFIGGKHVGGFDDVFWKFQEGTLTGLLVDAGTITNNYCNSAQLNSM